MRGKDNLNLFGKVIFQFLVPKMMPQATEVRNPAFAGVGFILRLKILNLVPLCETDF